MDREPEAVDGDATGPEAARPRAKRSGWRRAIDGALWLLVLGMLGWRFGPQLLAATGVGDMAIPAPAFEVSTLDGDTISLDGLRGNVVLVNFWATWCGPCRLEMPAFEQVWRERKADGLVILGLSTDVTGAAAVREFATARDITYPIAMAPRMTIRDFGGIRALPTSFLIDREGRIRHQVTGYFAEPALRAALGRLLDEEPE